MSAPRELCGVILQLKVRMEVIVKAPLHVRHTPTNKKSSLFSFKLTEIYLNSELSSKFTEVEAWVISEIVETNQYGVKLSFLSFLINRQAHY